MCAVLYVKAYPYVRRWTDFGLVEKAAITRNLKVRSEVQFSLTQVEVKRSEKIIWCGVKDWDVKVSLLGPPVEDVQVLRSLF